MNRREVLDEFLKSNEAGSVFWRNANDSAKNGITLAKKTRAG